MAQKLIAGRASLDVRALSRTLRRWRTNSDLSLSELGDKVNCSGAKLSQLSTAVMHPSPSEVLKIGTACGVSDEEIDLCARVAQRALDPQTWDRLNGHASAQLKWTSDEVLEEASEVVIVAADVLPDIVRVDAYDHALQEAYEDVDDLDLTVRQRALRRSALTAKEAARRSDLERLRVRLIVAEPVLNVSLGTRVMSEQLGHLEELNQQPGFKLSIIDSETPPCFGTGASFTVMRFLEERFDDVVLLRTLHGGDTWLEPSIERAPYERALAALDDVARSKEESSRWLSRARLRLQEPLPSKGSGSHLSLISDKPRT
ncbi:Scr1 family TA system antitoxin-like transcriptional regulator [Streptomyces sp. ID05-26A]|nr:Scr1 family TA system antitoxin-like transcriptional regulator [Streptomyces sp. ID05-26A]